MKGSLNGIHHLLQGKFAKLSWRNRKLMSRMTTLETSPEEDSPITEESVLEESDVE